MNANRFPRLAGRLTGAVLLALAVMPNPGPARAAEDEKSPPSEATPETKRRPALMEIPAIRAVMARTGEGVRTLATRAAAGDPAAQVLLGDLYLAGKGGVGRSLSKARAWYERAAESGSAEGRFKLATMYLESYAAPVEDKAKPLLAMAAAQGHAAARAALDGLDPEYELLPAATATPPAEAAVRPVRRDAERGFAAVRRRALAGDAAAQLELGLMYDNGHEVAEDKAKAAKWYRLAALQGVARAQDNLALMYDGGEGVARDAAEAVKWFRLAAAQGYASAQNNLATKYMEGDGVARDDGEAIRLYRLSARQGDVLAQRNLGIVFENGMGVAADGGKAAEWYRRAAEQGDATAQGNLGSLLARGEGVSQDVVGAYKWLTLGASGGDAVARDNLKAIEPHLSRKQIARGRAQAEAWAGRHGR